MVLLTRCSSSHFVENSYGRLHRVFTLPGTVNAKIGAVYRDGVREVVLPMKEEVKPRKVAIK